MELTVVVLADAESHGDLGRLANALETASEASRAGAAVEIVFDGAATRWIELLEEPRHKYHSLWAELKPVAGACAYCARAFGVLPTVRASGVALIDENRGHPSLYGRLEQGKNVLIF